MRISNVRMSIPHYRADRHCHEAHVTLALCDRAGRLLEVSFRCQTDLPRKTPRAQIDRALLRNAYAQAARQTDPALRGADVALTSPLTPPYQVA